MSFRSANNNTQEHIDVQIKVQVNKQDFQKEPLDFWCFRTIVLTWKTLGLFTEP